MASRRLEVTIAGDTRDFARALKSAGGQAAAFEKRTQLMSRRVGAAFKFAGTAAAAGLLVGLKKSVEAAAEAEKSQARMTAHLKASGVSYREHSKQIEDVIAKHSKLSAFDDEDLQDSFTNLVRATGDVDKSLRLTGVAADLARGKQLDVAKAGEIVAKVAGGNTGVLARYGIEIKKGATASEALAELQKKFAGQAEAYGKTQAGAQDRMRNAFGNLAEVVGAQVTRP